MVKDIGDLCVWCRRDTSFGSGLFVNRYYTETDEGEIGYTCVECEKEIQDEFEIQDDVIPSS